MDTGIIVGILGIAVSILAILIGVVIARSARKRPDLRYVVDHDVLLDATRKLNIQGSLVLGGHRIESISRFRIALWNQKGDSIRKEEIVATDPFRLQFDEDTAPISVRVIRWSAPQTDLSVTIDPDDCSSVRISFDFLREKDGGVIEVISRGVGEPKVQGFFKEATVTAVGSGALDPRDLNRIARKSGFHRLLLGASTVNAVLTFTGFAAFAATIAGTLFIDTPLVGDSSKLIKVGSYQLGTQSGQIGFAKAIIKTNYYDRASWLIFGWVFIGIGVTGIFSLSIVVYKFLRTRIPPSVVAHGEAARSHSPQENHNPRHSLLD